MSIERRRHPRVELFAQVEVASSDVVHLLRASNASRGGLFLSGSPENYPQLEPNTVIQIHVCELLEGEGGESDDSEDLQVEARARVIRIVREGNAHGFAVEFVDLDGENQARLDRLISRGKPLESQG